MIPSHIENMTTPPDFMFEEAAPIDQPKELKSLIEEANNVGGPDTAARPEAASSEGVKIDSIVSGMVAIEAADALIPVLLVSLSARVSNVKIDKKYLRLTQGQKETIAPVLEKCLATLTVNLSNPWYQLAIVAGGVYGGKFIEGMQMAEKISPEEKAARKENLNTGGRPRKTCRDCGADLTAEEQRMKLPHCLNEEHRKPLKDKK